MRNSCLGQTVLIKIHISVNFVGMTLVLFPWPPTSILIFFGRNSNVKIYF